MTPTVLPLRAFLVRAAAAVLVGVLLGVLFQLALAAADSDSTDQTVGLIPAACATIDPVRFPCEAAR